MRNEDIIRAWKDEAFRESLALDLQKHVPDHPAGMIEISDEDLYDAAGGSTPLCFYSGFTISVSITYEIGSYFLC